MEIFQLTEIGVIIDILTVMVALSVFGIISAVGIEIAKLGRFLLRIIFPLLGFGAAAYFAVVILGTVKPFLIGVIALLVLCLAAVRIFSRRVKAEDERTGGIFHLFAAFLVFAAVISLLNVSFSAIEVLIVFVLAMVLDAVASAVFLLLKDELLSLKK